MQRGSTRTLWEAAVASESRGIRSGQGITDRSSHQARTPVETCAGSSFAEVLHSRAVKSQEKVVAALTEHGVS